ncbi:MAG: chemotaxis-specific protein-glutamate methyltransferase CheB [Magnetococcales bacterium]|nr:chemotaxis-specific protein-glutamate methyltransferase CheB [Magnetococcales bacterium]
MAKSLKVMVVDDTITYRMIMKKVAESIPGILVTATASNGKLAVDKIQSLIASKSDSIPDMILLDVEMPVMDGLTTLKHVRKNHPEIAVVMVSALSRSNANIVLECLNAGALDFVTKPLESHVDRAKAALRHDLEPILSIVVKEKLAEADKKAASETAPPSDRKTAAKPIKTVTKRPAFKPFSPAKARPGKAKLPAPQAARVPLSAPGPAVKTAKYGSQIKPDLILIGSSTGGPAALTKLLGSLGGMLPVPTLIVQHMPPVFTASLAAQLTRTSGLIVKEAQDNMPLTPGSITIAMGGRHMTLLNDTKSLKIALNDGEKVNECRPAVDVLFMSAVASFTGNILAIILTGMGRDGANGVDALKRAGRTFCITQDKRSCVVYGMPRSVDEKNLSDLSLPLDEIGPTIVKICS